MAVGGHLYCAVLRLCATPCSSLHRFLSPAAAIRDGLNLKPLEYVFAQSTKHNPGVVVIRCAAAHAVQCVCCSRRGGLRLSAPRACHRHSLLRVRCTCLFVVCDSEFAGVSRVLNGALTMNPWKAGEISQALHAAVNMSTEERAARQKASMRVCEICGSVLLPSHTRQGDGRLVFVFLMLPVHAFPYTSYVVVALRVGRARLV